MATVLAAFAAVSLGITLAAHAAVRRLLARRPAQPGPTPPVSVLKPLKGLDDGLYENLASFAAQAYPEFELLFGTPDPDDPALALVRLLEAAFPHVPMSVIVCDRRFGRNPKVSTLAALLVAARHEHVLISDSNVRVGPDYLREAAAELADPRVGLVTHLVAGTGERRAGAAFENAHLASFVAGGVAAAALFARRPVVIGKSMLFRRADLERAGGLRGVRHILAEDYVLGRRFEAVGRRVVIARHVVCTVNETWGVGRFVARHVRWGQLRRRLAPAAYLGEPLLNPVLWLAALLVAAAAGVPARPLGPEGLAAAALSGIAVKVASDAALVRRLRGVSVGPRYLALLPVKDLLWAGIWLVAAFRRHVEWRGTPLRIGPGSRLLPCHRSRRPAGPASARAAQASR